MQVPRWVPFAFRQSMANMQTPLWLVFLDMQGRFRMFLPAVPILAVMNAGCMLYTGDVAHSSNRKVAKVTKVAGSILFSTRRQTDSSINSTLITKENESINTLAQMHRHH
jgi:hypothetical protein